ncbi:uncharacterized protein LOC125529591 isoform X2 [Triticum urartu]|uniref:uncharacterized protein LOC125529591 isoform X2 n=1 Tax=Triticum urartu TaxID=4572 RepID=UPI002043B752|nr:uncharacterized protein LOC125529591 isoform X2 [Triticum urartu]
MAATLKGMWGQVMGKKGEAMRELEVSIRAKGNVTQMEDALLRACMLFSNLSYTATSAVVSLVGAFASGQGCELRLLEPNQSTVCSESLLDVYARANPGRSLLDVHDSSLFEEIIASWPLPTFQRTAYPPRNGVCSNGKIIHSPFFITSTHCFSYVIMLLSCVPIKQLLKDVDIPFYVCLPHLDSFTYKPLLFSFWNIHLYYGFLYKMKLHNYHR